MLNRIKSRLFASSGDLTSYLLGKMASQHYQFFCVLEADKALNENLLMLAAKWAYQAVPVLNCQLVLDSERPYWKPRLSRNFPEICSMVETQDSDYAIHSFMSVSLDPCQDTLVQVRLVRESGRDFLCVKISQACTDAVGLKEYIAVLIEAYNALAKGKAFTARLMTERRDFTLISEYLGLKSYQELPEQNIKPYRAEGFPSLSREHSTPHWIKCSLGSNEYNKLKSYAAAKAVTVNDLLLTAFCRAYAKITGQLNREYSIAVTFDLRRFAQKVSQTANFSNSFVINAACYEGESFLAVLLRISQTTKREKAHLAGVYQSLKQDWVFERSYVEFAEQVNRDQASLSLPTFSNTGFFSPQVICFGEATIKSAYILPPPLFAPGFLLLTSTYNNVLTMSAGYYQPAVPRETIDILFAGILQDLRGC